MNCESHADREGKLTVDLPSIGIKRYMCEECRKVIDQALATPYKGKREAWQDWSGWEMSPSGENYITNHAYLNPNAIYARDKARSNKGDL